jgi:glycosyltransferase involved in cell wall biosynthesis
MKVLVISHSCVTDVNQQQFAALNAIPDTEVALIIPSVWRSEYTGKRHKPGLLPSITFPIYQAPIAIPGHISLHFYTSLPLKELRRFGPDVLLSTQEPWSFSGLQAVWLARELRCPLVFQTNQNLLKKYPPPFSWIEQISYRTAKVALSYSEEARQVLLRKGCQLPSQVVSYGTDLSLFHPHGSESKRCELNLCGKIVVGYLGRFVPEKGLDTLVEAAKILQTQCPSLPFSVLLVGSGPEETTLKQKIRQVGLEKHFVFAGAVPHREAGAYLNCMDIFALPSRTTATWKEQFGRVILEALACGIPVVGSDSGQIPHLLQETGGGLVFEEGNACALATQLGRLIHQPRTRACLGHIGREAVHASFTFEAVAAQLHGILQSVAAEFRS